MKHVALLLSFLMFACTALSQHGPSAPAGGPAPTLPGLGDLHHPVSTKNAEAQRFFDQGLSLSFAFNHDEALRAFQRAAELDHGLAMAWWGQALVLGPNINLPMDDARGRRAVELAQKARELAKQAPENERAYIEALVKRYSSDSKADRAALDRAYADAMRDVMKRYPDDLDAATLFAEAAMDITPWSYWTRDGKPNPGTEEIVAVLQSVLRRSPGHAGACHLLIHAVEASRHPELALGAARQLETVAPNAGHLVHMPTHLYALLGDHDASARINEKAAAVDRSYIQRYGVEGVYPALYYNHNLHFAAYSHAQRGDYRNAIRMADQVFAHAAPGAKEMPMIELFTPTPLLVQVRFRRWSEVMRAPEPPEHMPITRAVWTFARGMAEVSTGRTQNAQAALRGLAAGVKALPADAMVGFNSGKSVLAVAEHLLAARIAEERREPAVAIEHLKRAVEKEDALAYDEPPDWYLHARESLGGTLLRQGQLDEAEAAFRADLFRHPRSGRSLFGLMEVLKAQGKTWEARAVERDFRESWKHADSKLALTEL